MPQGLFYLCAMTPADSSGGILGYELDNAGVPVQKFHQPFCGCNFLCRSVDGKVLYSTCIIDGAGGAAAFRIREDGSLEYLNRVSSNGRSTCYICAAPGGRFLYTANYFSSNISEFSLNGDGSIKTLVRDIKFTGCGPDERQDAPHPHSTSFTPDQKYLLVTDLGTDEIRIFDFDPECGIVNAENFSVFRIDPAGSGPRHIIFNRSGSTAYVINEIGNTVSVLSYGNGKFTFRQQVSTLPENVGVYSKAAAIRLSADEAFLAASNRGYDSTAVFRVLPDDTLELQEIVPSNGSSPRDVNFLPGNRHLVMANEFSDEAVFFDFDPDCGKLTANGQTLKLPRPLFVYW